MKIGSMSEEENQLLGSLVNHEKVAIPKPEQTQSPNQMLGSLVNHEKVVIPKPEQTHSPSTNTRVQECRTPIFHIGKDGKLCARFSSYNSINGINKVGHTTESETTRNLTQHKESRHKENNKEVITQAITKGNRHTHSQRGSNTAGANGTTTQDSDQVLRSYLSSTYFDKETKVPKVPAEYREKLQKLLDEYLKLFATTT